MYSFDYFFSLNAVLAINALVLFFELIFVLVIQGGKSLKTGTKPKEDRLPGRPLPNPIESDFEAEARWKRIVDNHLETIPFAILIFLIAVSVVRNPDSRLALIIVITLYTFFRILFTVFYALAAQPWRSISWGLSMFCILAGGFIGVIDSFQTLDDSYNYYWV